MEIYIQSDKIQVSVLDISVNSKYDLIKRSVKLYYESDENTHTNIILPTPQLIDNLIIPKLNWYNQHKGIAMENAESNLNYLNQVLKKYYSTNDYPTDAKPLDDLDFMGKRNILSNHLIKKNKVFHDIKEFSTKACRAKYTSLFYKYILERNILAHGIFVFCIVRNNFYLEHTNPNFKKTAYALLTNESFTTFSANGEWIKEVMIKMESKLRD